MSSFDKTAGKNLDEILASIRKTLANESTPPQPDSPGPLQTGGGAAVSRNGSPAQSDEIDDDLADLLAGGLGGSPSQSVGKEASGPEPVDHKDPLWFLRPSGGREPQVLPLSDDRNLDTLADGTVLTPPERSSLSPQFIADDLGEGGVRPTMHDQAVATPTSSLETAQETKPASNGLATDAIGPGAGSENAAPVRPATGAKAPAAEPLGSDTDAKAEASPASAAKPDGAKASAAAATGAPVTPSPAVNPGAAPVKSDPPQRQAAVGVKPSEPAAPRRPAAPAAATMNSATPRGASLNGAPAAPASAAAASMPLAATAVTPSQTQALEQIIEQLLEPLLRRWVEANLPGMVEAAIRSEVARMLERKSVTGHEADPKP